MIKKDDIKIILDSVRPDWQSVSEKDIAFAVLCDTFEDKNFAYRIAYRSTGKEAEEFYNRPRFKKLLDALEPFGVGIVDNNTITKEENKSELLKLLGRIDDMLASNDLDPKDAIKMQTDIRVKLNDKFEMEESQKQKRIIVVPAKHDIVCPKTNRECNYWPTKKACCNHFGLIDPSENNKQYTEPSNSNNNEQEETDDNQ